MNKINLIGTQEHNLGKIIDTSFKFDHSLVLTYTVDLLLYEKTLLRNFLLSGSTNNILIADKDQLLQSQNSQHKFIGRDSSSYVFYPFKKGNIFHPKVFLLVSDTETRLFIGSGNLTISGLSLNQELYSEYTSQNESHRVLISELISFIEQLADQEIKDEFVKNRLKVLLDSAR